MNTQTEPKRGRGRPAKVKVNEQDIKAYKARIGSLTRSLTESNREKYYWEGKYDVLTEKIDEQQTSIKELQEKILRADKALQQSIDSMNMLEAEVDKQDVVIKLLSEALFLTNGGKKNG